MANLEMGDWIAGLGKVGRRLGRTGVTGNSLMVASRAACGRRFCLSLGSAWHYGWLRHRRNPERQAIQGSPWRLSSDGFVS